MKGDKIVLNYKCILHLTQHLQAVELSILVEKFLNTFLQAFNSYNAQLLWFQSGFVQAF